MTFSEKRLLRDILLILAVVFTAALWNSDALARVPHLGRVSIIASPILQANTVNMGLLTRTGRGAVATSAETFTTTAIQPVTFYGLDFDTHAGTPCATATWTFKSGRNASDFTLQAADTAWASSITPVVSSTGQNNLSGDYVFTLVCKDASGNASNPVDFKYVGVANAVNWGNQSGDVTFGIWPSGFGNVAGAKVLLSTGFSKTGRTAVNIAATFANQVTWQHADPDRPGQMVNLELAGQSNVRMYRLVSSGDLNGKGLPCVFCFTSGGGLTTGNVIEDVHGYFKPDWIINTTASLNGLDMKGCTSGCQINNSSMDYLLTGLNLGDTTSGSISHLTLSHIYINFVQAANSGPWDISDVKLIAPMINDGDFHTDYWQFANGSTPKGYKFRRIAALQADGVVPSQGVFFGGGGSEGLVYVDDGTAAHGPGKVVTRTSGVFEASANGSHVYSGTDIPFEDNIVLTCASSSCLSKTVGTLSLASDVIIGSPTSPVQLYAASNENVDLVGMIMTMSEPNGTLLGGSAGTSQIKNVTTVQHSPTPFSETEFTGVISGNNLTVSGPISSNIAGTPVPPINAQMTLRYAGCAGDGTGATYNTSCGVINSQTSGTHMMAGVYKLNSSPGDIGPVTMHASFAFKPVGIPSGTFRPGSCSSTDANRGTFTVDGIYYQGGTSGSPCPPANMTITHSFFGVSALSGADFASGVIPETTLEAINRSAWLAMTDDQKLATVCNAILPAAGGNLDGGGGVWYGAVTGTGEWNDGSGTPIVGCAAHTAANDNAPRHFANDNALRLIRKAG